MVLKLRLIAWINLIPTSIILQSSPSIIRTAILKHSLESVDIRRFNRISINLWRVVIPGVLGLLIILRKFILFFSNQPFNSP